MEENTVSNKVRDSAVQSVKGKEETDEAEGKQEPEKRKKQGGVTGLQTVLCILLCGLFALLTRTADGARLKQRVSQLLQQSVRFEELVGVFGSVKEFIAAFADGRVYIQADEGSVHDGADGAKDGTEGIVDQTQTKNLGYTGKKLTAKLSQTGIEEPSRTLQTAGAAFPGDASSQLQCYPEEKSAGKEDSAAPGDASSQLQCYPEEKSAGKEDSAAPGGASKTVPCYPEEKYTVGAWMPAQGRVSSEFGERTNPVTGEYTFHSGVDIAADFGSPVKAAYYGKVERTGESDISGRFIIMKHPGDTETRYCHLEEIMVKEGTVIRPGEVIAKVGSTGQSTGPHLHFEVYFNGTKTDPRKILDFQEYDI